MLEHTAQRKVSSSYSNRATGLKGTLNDHLGCFPAQSRLNYTYFILFIRPPDPAGGKQIFFGALSPLLSLKPHPCVTLVQPSATPLGLVRDPFLQTLPSLHCHGYNAAITMHLKPIFKSLHRQEMLVKALISKRSKIPPTSVYYLYKCCRILVVNCLRQGPCINCIPEKKIKGATRTRREQSCQH